MMLSKGNIIIRRGFSVPLFSIVKSFRNNNNINSSIRSNSSKPDARQQQLMARGLPKKAPIPGVNKIIIVASGKGGVGKSTCAVNLSCTLASLGKKVGILDADVFGPSVPLMMNILEEPLVNDQNLMIPPINYGVKCLSMGLLAQTGAVIWRGPLVMSALARLLKGAEWGPLDILVIDTPPGTGDIHLSLAQNIPIDGVLLVSTPQVAALEVTARGADMFKTLNIPLIGLIENMQYAICGNCNTRMEIFKNVTQKYADKLGTKILTSIPLDGTITESCDTGMPLAIKQSDSQYGKSFRQLAKNVIEYLDKT